VAEALRAHRRRLVVAQHPGLAAGWVFPAAGGGLHRGSPIGRVLAEACAAVELGRRVTTHGLRHTANDLLRRVAPSEVTRAIVGHATAQMTHHYSHVDEGEKRAAATRVLEIVRPIRTGDKTGDSAALAGVAAGAETTNPAVTRG
jgi:integrase